MAKKRVRLAIRRGFYLRSSWTVLAEILGDNRPIAGLPCVQISLGCLKVRGSSGLKRAEIGPENQFFEKVPSSYRGKIFLYRTQILPKGPRWSRKNFSFGRVFLVLARSDPVFDMQCGHVLWIDTQRFLTERVTHLEVLNLRKHYFLKRKME